MKSITLAILLLLLLIAPWSAVAQDQTTLNRQAESDYKAADAKLNQVYQALTAKLDPDTRRKMVTSEQAWIKFRDADAETRAASAQGGSMRPLLYFGWMTRITQARTQQLQTWLHEFK